MRDKSDEELPPRQAAFVREYSMSLNGTQAAILAGYSKHTAAIQASRLLTRPSIVLALARRAAIVAEKADISQSWVMDNLQQNATEARNVSQYGPSTRALELIGKHTGLWPDKQPTLLSNVNVLVTSPEWLSLRGIISKALQPFPEARAAVVEALRDAERQEDMVEDMVENVDT